MFYVRRSTAFETRILWCFTLIAFIVAYLIIQNQKTYSSQSTSSDILQRSLPLTYRSDRALHSPFKTSFVRVPRLTVASSPLITAVILNWSRLPNVVRIVSLLCSPSLNDTIASISVWNNSPRKLSGKVSGTSFYVFAR
jgi:hypothetical protein